MKDLKETLSIYFHGLKAAVAPTLSMPKDRFAFVAAVWHYIFRLSGRLDRLIARWKNGTLPKPRPPQPGRTGATQAGKPKFRLPSSHKWLLHRIQGTAFAGSQLAHLIATNAELHEFLEAAPQGRRLLNPLCRALGIDFDKPTGVALPKPTAKPKPESAESPPAQPPAPMVCAPQPTGSPPAHPIIFSSA
jgi:hypothetical protein